MGYDTITDEKLMKGKKQRLSKTSITVRFAGDSGDGMQMTGDIPKHENDERVDYVVTESRTFPLNDRTDSR